MHNVTLRYDNNRKFYIGRTRSVCHDRLKKGSFGKEAQSSDKMDSGRLGCAPNCNVVFGRVFLVYYK